MIIVEVNNDRQCVTNCSKLSDMVARKGFVKCMRRLGPDNGRSRRLCATWSNYISPVYGYTRTSILALKLDKAALLIVICNNKRDSDTV